MDTFTKPHMCNFSGINGLRLWREPLRHQCPSEPTLTPPQESVGGVLFLGDGEPPNGV